MYGIIRSAGDDPFLNQWVESLQQELARMEDKRRSAFRELVGRLIETSGRKVGAGMAKLLPAPAKAGP